MSARADTSHKAHIALLGQRGWNTRGRWLHAYLKELEGFVPPSDEVDDDGDGLVAETVLAVREAVKNGVGRAVIPDAWRVSRQMVNGQEWLVLELVEVVHRWFWSERKARMLADLADQVDYHWTDEAPTDIWLWRWDVNLPGMVRVDMVKWLYADMAAELGEKDKLNEAVRLNGIMEEVGVGLVGPLFVPIAWGTTVEAA